MKFPVFSLARNYMVREISDTQKPLQFRVHEITDVEIVAKLPDTQKLQHVYCTNFDDTFNFHAWYWKTWYRLFTPSTPHDMFPGQHCISLHFRNFFVGLQYYTENDLSPPRQGARKVIFKACHSGKLKLAYTSPNVISTSPKNISMSRIDFTVLL